METANKALNAMQQVMESVSWFVMDQANQLDAIQQTHIQGKNPYIDKKINDQSERLVNWIVKHEELETKFAELLKELTDMREEYIKAIKRANFLYMKLENMELINKDVIYWKQKAEFAEATRKLIFSELTRLRNGKEN